MSLSTPSRGRQLVALIWILILGLALTGCGLLQMAAPPADTGADSQDAAPQEDEGADANGDSGEEGSESESAEGDDLMPVMLVCPPEPMEFFLVVSHTWDFSPNRDLEQMRVDGKTAPFVSCPLTIHKDKVTMEDCIFPITNTGFVQTDEGPCDVQASGYARLSADEPYCQDGKLTITFIESIDVDSGSDGAMNCPGFSQPYFPFFPHSITTRTFDLQVGGQAQTEMMDPDLSNQFRYQKEWSLHSMDLSAPEE